MWNYIKNLYLRDHYEITTQFNMFDIIYFAMYAIYVSLISNSFYNWETAVAIKKWIFTSKHNWPTLKEYLIEIENLVKALYELGLD